MNQTETIKDLLEVADGYQANGSCTNEPARFEAEILQADWQLIPGPLAVGKWLRYTNSNQLPQDRSEEFLALWPDGTRSLVNADSFEAAEYFPRKILLLPETAT